MPAHGLASAPYSGAGHSAPLDEPPCIHEEKVKALRSILPRHRFQHWRRQRAIGSGVRTEFDHHVLLAPVVAELDRLSRLHELSGNDLKSRSCFLLLCVVDIQNWHENLGSLDYRQVVDRGVHLTYIVLPGSEFCAYLLRKRRRYALLPEEHRIVEWYKKSSEEWENF